MDRRHLYHIYTKHQQSAYFVPYLEPKLQRYIHKRIPESVPAEVIKAAQALVEEVRQLPLERKDYTDIQKHQSGSITALLGYTLFVRQRVRLDKTLEILQRYFQGTDLEDVSQFSLVVLSHPTKFLKNFRAEQDWYESLGRYSHNKFPKSLTDELRKLAGDKFQRTNLGILARTSPRQIATIVAEQFIKDGEYFNRLVLLHQCFQETVTAKKFITNDPKPEHYDALLARYRERKTERYLEIADRAEVAEALEDLSNSVRNYYQPTGGAISLDTPMFEGEKSTSEVTLGEMLEAPTTSSSLEDGEKQELAFELLRENSLKFGVTVTEPNRKLVRARLMALQLFLLHGLDLNQTEVGEEVNLPQYTVSKQVKSEIGRLAKELYLRDENLPPVKQIPAEILDAYIDYLEPLCEDYYAQLAIDLLAETIASTTSGSIVEEFIDRIQTDWQFRFKPDGGGLARVYAFVKQRSSLFELAVK